VLLPSATVFLLLLCNDKAVLGPWVNSRRVNLFTGAVIALLVLLSVILTAAVLFPGIGNKTIIGVLGGGGFAALALWLATGGARHFGAANRPPADPERRANWRMPPLSDLSSRQLTLGERAWLVVLRGYLLVAAGLVLVRIVSLAIGGA
jgi:hypothetical protein